MDISQTTERFIQRSWGPVIGPVNYEFMDYGEVLERGIVASLEIVVKRFEAFKAIRPWGSENQHRAQTPRRHGPPRAQ